MSDLLKIVRLPDKRPERVKPYFLVERDPATSNVLIIPNGVTSVKKIDIK